MDIRLDEDPDETHFNTGDNKQDCFSLARSVPVTCDTGGETGNSLTTSIMFVVQTKGTSTAIARQTTLICVSSLPIDL